MRTIQEIYNEMIAAKNADQELSSLDNISQTAIWRLFLHIVAVVIYTLESLLDAFKNDVYAAINAKSPGDLNWYVQKAKAFQLGDLLNPETLNYNVLDTAKQIIKFAYAEESVNGGIILKILKHDTFLNEGELQKFTEYMERVKFAGVRISYVSIMPDELTLNVEVFYNTLASESDVQALFDNSVNAYLIEVGFNGVFRVNDLIERVRSIKEIVDVKFNQIEVIQNSVTALVDLRYVAQSGRLFYNADGSTILLSSE